MSKRLFTLRKVRLARPSLRDCGGAGAGTRSSLRVCVPALRLAGCGWNSPGLSHPCAPGREWGRPAGSGTRRPRGAAGRPRCHGAPASRGWSQKGSRAAWRRRRACCPPAPPAGQGPAGTLGLPPGGALGRTVPRKRRGWGDRSRRRCRTQPGARGRTGASPARARRPCRRPGRQTCRTRPRAPCRRLQPRHHCWRAAAGPGPATTNGMERAARCPPWAARCPGTLGAARASQSLARCSLPPDRRPWGQTRCCVSGSAAAAAAARCWPAGCQS